MNSSAITNSTMPTISIPGSTASESAGSGFGDVMASITENWSERKSQIKYDTAKSAQSTWDDSRADRHADRSIENDDAKSASRSDDKRDDEPMRAERNDRDDHGKTDDRKADDNRDVDTGSRDADRAEDQTQSADSDQPSDGNVAASDDDGAPSEDGKSAAGDKETAEGDDTQVELAVTDPNQPAQTVPLPGSQQAIDLAKAQAAASQSINANAGTNGQSGTPANGQVNPGMAANAAASDGTTDGLMSSTALSQPAAASSAKMAMNGVDTTAGDDVSSDKFLSRIVDAMSADGKAKTDATGITNATVNGQSANANGAQATATNPAQTAQAAQQAMAAAAGAQNMQNAAGSPQAQANAAANGTVTAAGASEATAQTAPGQLNSTNSLHQTNTGGQTAQTARQAPAQQVQQQVAVSIKNAASDGVDKISVQLRPEHLGRVDVKMEIGHDGRIQGVIQADTRETLDMLRQDSRALQQALKDAGLNADSQSFTFEHRDQGGRGQEGQSQSRMTANQGSSPGDGDILSGAELAEHVGIGYGINPNGLVDIRI